jgi:hypothetical protein
MSIAFGRNPNRRLVVESSPHAARLAELSANSAAAVRELAAHHVRLAAGAPPTASHDLQQFERNVRALPDTEELTARAARARSPSDHWQLEQYFRELAVRYATRADEHADIARACRAAACRAASDPALRSDRLATLWREAAAEATAGRVLYE